MRRQEVGPAGSRAWKATNDPGRQLSASSGGFRRVGTAAGPTSSVASYVATQDSGRTAPTGLSASSSGYRRSADASGPTSSFSKYTGVHTDSGKMMPTTTTSTSGGFRRTGDASGPTSSLASYHPSTDPCASLAVSGTPSAARGTAAAAAAAMPTQLGLGDTNIAHLGTSMEIEARKAAGATETNWAGVGQEPGMNIWRIEKFKVVPVDPRTYGSFFAGDSYIVLHTYFKAPESRALAWDIYFYLGRETTSDESGTAAYKAVELDDYLGGAPVEHREVMDHESAGFLGLFPQGLRVMDGGIDSGFAHVTAKEYSPRLLQLKGKKNVRLRQVPLSAESLNEGDVFVLDLGLKLIVFHGRKSNPIERTKGGDVCRALQSERDGKPAIVVFDQLDQDVPEEWAKILGSNATAIKSSSEGGDDAAFEKEAAAGIKKLFRVSDASGELKMISEAEGPAAVAQFKLDSNDAFVLDAVSEIWVWIGSKTTAQERKSGLHFAEEYLKQTSRPSSTPISRCLEGSEPKYFLDLLSS